MVDDQKPQKLHIASEDVADRFAKKMNQVERKQKETEVERLASDIGYPHINLEAFPVSQEALRQIPEDRARELRAVCFFVNGTDVRLGAVDPTMPEVAELLFQLEERTHAHGRIYAISEESLSAVLTLYKALPVITPVTKDIRLTEEDITRVSADVQDFSSLAVLFAKKNVTELVAAIFGAALKLGASDVHIEAEETSIVLRFRLDGILHDAATLDKGEYTRLVSRIKLLSGLKINVSDTPQDGRLTIKMHDEDIDLRVSTIPTVYGESVVLRILRQSRTGLSLDDLGIDGDALDRLKVEIKRPNGMIITTGPTGSGKTTTMYAVLQLLNQPGVKIITLEDPVEYKMEGVSQSQIDRSHEYTFASGLKSMLRQDPDIAMVGEIRDLETADIAIQAALTGHLMLSTIHTNSAAGAIPRFLAMGVKPFLLAPALNAVIGQRLVRTLCKECAVPELPTKEEQEKIDRIIASMRPEVQKRISLLERSFHVPRGCPACNMIGYKGRIGIYEIFIMNPDIERQILSGSVSEYDIEKAAIASGMTTMVQDGILKAYKGITSIAEVFRVSE